MIARPGALAGVAVDPRRPYALGDRRARQHEVDPHPEVLVEHAGAVVPVAEHALAGPAVAHDVAHSLEPLLELYERDEAEGEGDMPYPPDYPKMPGEPKRVQPSRDRDRKE